MKMFPGDRLPHRNEQKMSDLPHLWSQNHRIRSFKWILRLQVYPSRDPGPKLKATTWNTQSYVYLILYNVYVYIHMHIHMCDFLV